MYISNQKKLLSENVNEIINLAQDKGYSFTNDEFNNILKIDRIPEDEISDINFKLLSSMKEKIIKSSEQVTQMKEQEDKEKELLMLKEVIRNSIRLNIIKRGY